MASTGNVAKTGSSWLLCAGTIRISKTTLLLHHMEAEPAKSELPFDIEILSEAIDALGLEPIIDLSRRMVDTARSDIERLSKIDSEEVARVLHGMSGAAACCGASRLANLAAAKISAKPLRDDDISELMDAVDATQNWIEKDMIRAGAT